MKGSTLEEGPGAGMLNTILGVYTLGTLSRSPFEEFNLGIKYQIFIFTKKLKILYIN